ncbi:MAG: DUF7882 family protein [Pseudolysinimonas sp.]
MGQLIYGTQAASFDIDDRTLAHVEAVILAKLRRNESFALTLDTDHGGRETLWLSQAVQLRFSYTGERTKINRIWLEALIDTANSTAGMRILPEPSSE